MSRKLLFSGLAITLALAACAEKKPVSYSIYYPPSPVAYGYFVRHPSVGPHVATVKLTSGEAPSLENLPPAKMDSGIAFASPTPAATPEPAPDLSAKAVGIPVPGKPGFLKSPYSQTGSPIDARGFSPGSEVNDPETGKTFLVPKS